MLLTDPAQKLQTAHPRHHDVGDDQMNASGALLADIERLLPIGCGKHRVPDGLEDALNELAHPGVVFDDQNRLGPPRVGRGPVLAALRYRRALDPRKVNPERRAGANLAMDPDRAARLVHDSVDRREPEARSLSDFLRGEKGLEDPR